MRYLTTTLFVLLLPVCAFAGNGTAAPAGGLEPTLEAIQALVFTPSCAQDFCHGSAESAALDLRPGASYSNLVNVPSVEVPGLRVVPFDSDASYLICKLEACPEMVASQMPLIGDPLDPSVIAAIREWIDLGATEQPISVDATSWGQVKALYR